MYMNLKTELYDKLNKYYKLNNSEYKSVTEIIDSVMPEPHHYLSEIMYGVGKGYFKHDMKLPFDARDSYKEHMKYTLKHQLTVMAYEWENKYAK